MRSGRLTLIIAIAVLLSGCAATVGGTAQPAPGPPPRRTVLGSPSPATSPPSTGAAAQPGGFDLCHLLAARDLPYAGKGAVSLGSVRRNVNPDYEQSCEYAYGLHGKQVEVLLLFHPNRAVTIKHPAGHYRAGSHAVYYRPVPAEHGASPGCALAMDYAGGGLGVGVSDGTGAFGTPCVQGRAITALLAQREPAGH
ncbi:MAG: hypothetical protein ACRDRL_17275 [Sciscionella sp.]